jgi:hypothetical protein
VDTQAGKDAIVQGVREAVGRIEDFAKLDRSWLSFQLGKSSQQRT